jgi:RNA polymerase sigma-70 factor (ECF subfamily)
MGTTVGECVEAPAADTAWRTLFESLARRFYTGVCNYLCWLSRDAVLAEDLTQETFMRIWQHPPELRGGRQLRAWIFRLARNEYLQHRRRAGLDTVALEDGTEAEMTDWQTPGPQAKLEQAEFARRVHRAVDLLRDPYREVILLHNLEGLPLREVAEVLGVPLGTVKSRRAKALVLLRDLMAKETVP